MTHPPYVVLDKQRGETPLAALTRWRKENPDYAHLPATYAGRLDPMATGKLLVLLGETCKDQERFHKLDKTYEVTVALDMATDTGDILGMPSVTSTITSPTHTALREVLLSHTGTHTVPYPAFSSKPVNGIPLFQHTLQGTLDSITIPTHSEHIYTIHLLGTEKVSATALGRRILDDLSDAPRAPEPAKRLGDDFRQDAIRAAWRESFKALGARDFMLVRLKVTCATGTYMRSLAERIGASFGTRGMALTIHRTRIGLYQKIFGFGFWKKVY